jgi:hypothetical protein
MIERKLEFRTAASAMLALADRKTRSGERRPGVTAIA